MLKCSDFESTPRKSNKPSESKLAKQLEDCLASSGREELVPHVGMIFSLAWKYQRAYGNQYPELYDEMVQELYCTLQRIYDKFDIDRGTPLKNYLSSYLGQESKQIWRKVQGKKLPEDYRIKQEARDAVDLDNGYIVDRIEESIAKLSEYEQWIIDLKFYRSMSFNEIRQAWNHHRPHVERKGSITPFYVVYKEAIEKLTCFSQT